MQAFRKKQVSASVTLGDRLRKVREDMGWSINDAASRTGIRPAYLEAIEAGRYGDIPGAVYARNFVRKYALLLEVNETAALDLFDQEHLVTKQLAPSPIDARRGTGDVRTIITPQRIRWFLVILLGVGVLVYLGLELRNFTAPPTLLIEYPPEELTSAVRSVELRGTTDPEVTVTVNGRAIIVDRNGKFRQTLDLQDGLNTIIIRAQKKRGDATTAERQILVTSPSN